MILNNKNKSNKMGLEVDKKEDYYFSITDLLNAFYKRKVIFIVLFITYAIGYTIFIVSLPTYYKVGLSIDLRSTDAWRDISYNFENEILNFFDRELITETVVNNLIIELVDNSDLNESFPEEIQFDLENNIFFTITTQPDASIENIKSYIDLLSKKITINLETDFFDEIDELIGPYKDTIKSTRYLLKTQKEARITLLEEALEIANELGIVYPVMNYANGDSPLFTLGTEYLLTEIVVLKNRKNDKPFIFLEGDSVYEISRNLKNIKNLDSSIVDSLSPSDSLDRRLKIRLLETQLQSYVNHAKEIRLARIAILEEAYEFAKALGINKPMRTEQIPQPILFSEDSWGSYLNDEMRVFFPSAINSKLFKNEALMGSKHLSALINVLKNRENNDRFSKTILYAKDQLFYFEKFLLKIEGASFVAFNLNKEYLLNTKVPVNYLNYLVRSISIPLIISLLSILLLIIIKNDLRRNDEY